MNVLTNTPLSSLEGVVSRHFGECRPDGGKGYKPEAERRPLREILANLPDGFAPDLLLIRSPEYLPIPEDLSVFKGPRVLLITDWNVCLRFLPELCKLFDVCFTDAPGTRLLRAAGTRNVHQQPLFGHNPGEFRALDPQPERDLELSFCGNLNSGLHAERNRLIFRLAHFGQGRAVHLGQAFGADYLRILNRSRLVFNYSIRGEANMRLYEAMACGAAVMVEQGNEEVPLLFREGEHYLAYDPDQLESTCNAWLCEPERLRAIGDAARAAVAEQTQAKQIRRALDKALKLTGGKRLGDTAALPGAGVRKALKKTRILGAGYGVAEALAEIKTAEGELPGLAAETIPGLLLLFVESAGQDPAREAALAQLESQLRDPALPAHAAAWFRVCVARLRSQWPEALRQAGECLALLDSAPSAPDPGYGVFFHPVNLGLALNTDLNRCFRDFIETGNHASFFGFARNSVLAEAINACVQLGRIDQAEKFAAAMTAGPWREVSPWPWRFSLALLRGDEAAVTRWTWKWLNDNPLDARNWERIAKGLRALELRPLLKSFLEKVMPAARHFLSGEQIASLRALEQP